jgi:hypothetical protein
MTVAPTPVSLLTVTTTSLPNATAGISYSASLSASGGTLPYSWAIASGSLPPGLSISAGGTVTGTPINQGLYEFTVQATDSSSPTPQVASANLSVSVYPAPTPTHQSSNWSGYVVPSSTSPLTDVSGEWTVPTLNCSVTPNGGVATWVGIGGEEYSSGGSSGVLLQTGVTANCVNGAQQNVVGWWEEVPMSPNNGIAFSGFPVSSGDLIQASVFQTTSGAWETRVDNLSTGLSGIMVTGAGWGVYTDGSGGYLTYQGSTAGLSYSGGYTAEWIVEDLQQGGVLVPFADYGTVTFSNTRTSLPSWSLTSSEGVEIAQGGTVLSTPSPPSGSGFSVSYTG